MKEPKDHLNLDLGFLDKKEPRRTAPNQTPHTGQVSKTPVTSAREYNWKKILVVVGVIIAIGWSIASENGNSGAQPTMSSSNAHPSDFDTEADRVTIGEYSCSRYHYNQASSLDPSESSQQIEIARSTIKDKTDEISQLKDRIDSSDVNDNSEQWEIDQYNEMVDQYNEMLPTYKDEMTNFNARVERYNTQIQSHNSYLAANCTRR